MKIINKYENERKVKENLKFLDTIDILPFIKKNREICTLMCNVAEEYSKNTNFEIPKFLEGDIFNYVDNLKFVDYIRGRYGFKVTEVVTFYIEE